MTLITPTVREELTRIYSSQTRHYHTLKHVKALLELLETHRAHFTDPDAVEAAIWFHDAIYDPRAKGSANELKSAKLAVARLSEIVDSVRMERIRSMIEATATHVIPESESAAEAGDAAMFLDMDLSILGAEPVGFDEYEAAVRVEYAFIDDEGWRRGRAAVLRGFLEREWIFHSELFRNLYEDAARKNLRRSMASLEGSAEGVRSSS